MPIHIHRAYDLESMPQGYRVLVDRLWPRGVRKEDLPVDSWAKDLAPSTSLRKWFAHDPAKWTEFKKRYRAELKTHGDELRQLLDSAGARDLVLVYSARDPGHNQAVVLRDFLENLN